MASETAVSGVKKNDDIYISIEKGHEGVELEVQSTVYDLFGEQIVSVIRSVIEEQGITGIRVYAEDYGALDFVIRARMENAIARLKGGR